MGRKVIALISIGSVGVGVGVGVGLGVGVGAGAGAAQAAIKGNAASTRIKQMLPSNANSFLFFNLILLMKF